MERLPQVEVGFEDWRYDAACKGIEPNLFFPVGNTDPALEQTERAKEVCRNCTVQAFCLKYALDTREPFGIWGGATEEERRKMLRQRGIRPKSA
jgi:WhiB family transcriptional regulator, redox-sensing transcriptional regulator